MRRTRRTRAELSRLTRGRGFATLTGSDEKEGVARDNEAAAVGGGQGAKGALERIS